jgi:two-component system, OmpR family, alkaline phosphatase synthesis response regulator PhoP
VTSKVLLIEDNLDLAAGLEYNLRLEGYEVRIAEDGRDGLAAARGWSPDLVILDLMLPGLDGYEVLRSIRAAGDAVPVIILSARGEEADKVRGFRLDADQYVTKPFGVLELLERVRSLLRRAASRAAGSDSDRLLRFGVVTIDPASRTVMRGSHAVTLTPKAYDLLLALVRRRGAVATRVELLREVWGYGALVLSRTVDTHIAELRRKLEDDAAEPKHIVTVWKVGYRLED